MAKTAISAEDEALLRGTNQSIDSLALHITPLESVATGTIDAVPSRSPYVDITLTWDAGYSGVKVGQLVRISDGDSIVRTWAVVRKAPTASHLYISETPLGSAGYTTVLESPIQVGDYVEVFNHHPLWGLYSRINERNFYKQWDLAYSDQNEQPPPVANTGTWQAAQIAVGASASFRLPRIGSNTSFAMSGTVSSYLWTLPTGVTLQGGYALTDSVIEVDAVAGFHLLSLRVTDSNGKTHTAYCWLFVSDNSTWRSLSEQYGTIITKDEQTLQGRKLGFTITGNTIDDTSIYPGAGILLREWSNFDDEELTTGVLVDTFVGYVTSFEFSYDGMMKRCTIEAESPMLYAKRIVQPQQSLEEVSDPASWVQCTSALSNPRGYLYYLAKWHTPALLDMHDLDAPYTTPRRKYLDFPSKTLGGALDIVAQLIAGNVGSASDGTTVLRKNENLRDSRSSYIWYMYSEDVRAPFQYTYRLNQPYRQAKTGAFAFDGSSSKAWATMKRWYQGVGETELPAFSVTTAEGVQEAKEVVGHFLAQENRRIETLGLDLTRNQDLFDPAWMGWYVLWIRTFYDAQNRGMSEDFDERFMVVRVTRDWSLDEGLKKRIHVDFQPETMGEPGEEVTYGKATSQVAGDSGFSAVTSVAYTPKASSMMGGSSLGAGIALALTEDGNLAVSANLIASSPDWGVMNELVTGEISDVEWDYNSDFFTQGYDPREKLGVYVVSIDGTTLTLSRITDIKDASPQAETVTTLTMADSNNLTEARVTCSKEAPLLVVVAWHAQTGTRFVRSADGGATWSAVASIGTSVSDVLNDNSALGLAIYDEVQLTSAPDSDKEYGIYGATTAGGAFSALGSTPRSDLPSPMIKIGSSNNAYVTLAPKRTKTRLTFDAGGEPSYVLSGTGVPTVTTGGNPSNCVKISGNTNVFSTNLMTLTITFGTRIRLGDIGFDIYGSNTQSQTSGIVVTLKNNGLTVQSHQISNGMIGYGGAWQTIPSITAFDEGLEGLVSGAWVDEVVITVQGYVFTGAWDYRIDNILFYHMDNLDDFTAVDFEDNEEFSAYVASVGAGDTLTRTNYGLLGRFVELMSNYTGLNTASSLDLDVTLPSPQLIRAIAFNYAIEKDGGSVPTTPESFNDSSLAIYNGATPQWSGGLTKFSLMTNSLLFMQGKALWVFEPFFKQYGDGGVTGDNVVANFATTAYDGDKVFGLDSIFIFNRDVVDGVFYETNYGVQTITNTATRCTGAVAQTASGVELGYPMFGKCYRGTAASASAGTDTFVGIETEILLPDYIALWDVNLSAYFSYVSGTDNPNVILEIYEKGQAVPTTFNYADAFPDIWNQYFGRMTFGMSRSYITKRIVVRIEASTDDTNYDLRLDSIILFKQPFNLYRILDFDGTPAWTDITPDGEAPVRPYGLVSDLATHQRLFSAGDAGTWSETDDAGGTWSTREAESDRRTFLMLNDTIVSAGDDLLDVSLDDAVTQDDKTGNMATALGDAIGTIKRLLVL